MINTSSEIVLVTMEAALVVAQVEATRVATLAMAPTTTVVTAPVLPTVPMNHGEKPKKYNDTNFKRSHQKILFYLTILGLAKFMWEDELVVTQGT